MNPRATLLRFGSLSPGSPCEPSSADTCEPFGVPALDSLSVEDAAEYAAWADSLDLAGRDAQIDAGVCDAMEGTRDDGSLYHERTPMEDNAEQWFNPGHMASAACGPVASVESMAEQVLPPVVIVEDDDALPAWMLRALGASEDGTGDITDELMMRHLGCAGRA